MDERRRRELLHYGGPAAFLVAVTIAVVLIQSGLSGGSSESAQINSVAQPPTTQRTSTQRTTTKTTATVAARYYTIQSGDTFGSVAVAEKTTVAELLRLNPGVDPQSLHVGQRIRVG